MKKRNILLTPGPIPVPGPVREVLGEEIIHHRTPQYRKIFEQATLKLQKVFRTQNPVYTITGSGSSAMEASIVNFHKAGDETIVVESGKFAERFTHLAKAFGLRGHIMKIKWGEAVNPNAVRELLTKNPKVRSVCVQLCETSTAVLNDIEALAKITAGTDAILIVDAISGLGADRLETDKWGVDIVIAGSQKALMLPPGLGFISVSPKAAKRMAESDIPKFYLDLKLYEKALKDWDTPFTPALGIVRALSKALDLIEADGLEARWKKAHALGEWTRKKFTELGMAVYSKAPSSTVTAAVVPDGVDGGKLVKIMRDDKGVTLAGGQGELKGKIVRIAHMGSITQADLEEGFAVLKETLEEMKVSKA